MALADTKQVQTMINIAAEQIVIMRAAASTLQDVKDAFLAASPDVTGTVLAGCTASLNSNLNDLQTEIDQNIWTELIAAHVPSHRNEALDY